MLYQTIVLELLRQRPRLHRQLRRDRQMLKTVHRFANQLKDSHEVWKTDLTRVNPDRDPLQIRNEAMEKALQELVTCLPAEPGRNTAGPLSLEEAMTFIRKATPVA
jgi:tRNA nucleotidyltransferase (CCA-adding enzyme)